MTPVPAVALHLCVLSIPLDMLPVVALSQADGRSRVRNDPRQKVGFERMKAFKKVKRSSAANSAAELREKNSTRDQTFHAKTSFLFGRGIAVCTANNSLKTRIGNARFRIFHRFV